MADYPSAACALSVTMFAFAAYLFLLWARKRDRRKDLALSVLFVVMGCYDAFVSRVYGSAAPADSISWLRLLSAADNLAAPAFLWYFAEYTGLVPRRALAAWASLFALLAAAEILVPGNFAWIASKPLSFVVKLPLLRATSFNQVSAGPLGAVAAAAGLAFVAYCIAVLRRCAAAGRGREAGGFAAVLVAVFLAILSDTLIGMGAYRFIFLTEYAWAGALVFLTFRSSEDILIGTETLERLAKSEARLGAMVERVPFNIWMCDAEGRLIMQNAADVATVGDHLGELYTEWKEPNGDLILFAELCRRALAGEAIDRDISYQVAGQRRIFRDIISPARAGEAVVGTVGIGIDITDQARAEAELKARLAEKEVLLREVHHRVKNNLQVIASLVSLRSDGLDDERSKEAFLDVQRQVRAIAKVHESLYLSDNLSAIDFGGYLRGLVHELVAMRGGGGIRTELGIENLVLGIDASIPCALVVNELVTNSLKHAYGNGRPGRLSVSLRALGENRAELAVEDDGDGIPEEASAARGSSMGLVLVASLASQLRGELRFCGPRRNRVELTFPTAST